MNSVAWLNWMPTFLIRVHHLSTSQMGAAFGIAISTDRNGKLRFFAVDDNTNSLDVFTFGG